MSRVSGKNALLALAGAIVIAGVLTAVLSSGGGRGRLGGTSTSRAAAVKRRRAAPSQAAVAARYLGLSRAALRRKLRSGHTLAQLAAGIPGKSASGLLAALLAARTARLEATAAVRHLTHTARARRVLRLRKRIEAELERVPGYTDLGVDARYLGIGVARLNAELGAGKSLAEIAAATPGRSAAGLINAAVHTREAAIKASLAAHTVSHATAGGLLADLRHRVTEEVQRAPAG